MLDKYQLINLSGIEFSSQANRYNQISFNYCSNTGSIFMGFKLLFLKIRFLHDCRFNSYFIVQSLKQNHWLGSYNGNSFWLSSGHHVALWCYYHALNMQTFLWVLTHDLRFLRRPTLIRELDVYKNKFWGMNYSFFGYINFLLSLSLLIGGWTL